MEAGEEVLLAVEVVERQIGGKAVLGRDQHVGRLRLRPHLSQHIAHGNTFPHVIELRPPCNAVDIVLSLDVRQGEKLLPGPGKRCFDQPIDLEGPCFEVDPWDVPVVQYRPLEGERLARREAPGALHLLFPLLALLAFEKHRF